MEHTKIKDMLSNLKPCYPKTNKQKTNHANQNIPSFKHLQLMLNSRFSFNTGYSIKT